MIEDDSNKLINTNEISQNPITNKNFQPYKVKTEKKKEYSNFLASFILLILAGLLLYHFTQLDICKPIFLDYLNHKRIFFGLISMPNIARQNVTYQYWVKELYNRGIDDAAFITKYSRKKIPTVKYIYPTKEDNKMRNIFHFKDTDRGMKRVVGAKHFLSRSFCSWYFTMTDDVLIDLDSLDKMMEELERKYNPEKDIVIKGHLMASGQYIYPQGGAGYLMSRAAARQFVSFGEDWAKRLKRPDDFYFIEVIDRLKVPIQDVSSPYIYGNANVMSPPPEAVSNCNAVPECPANYKTCPYVTPLTPINRFAILHYHHHYNVKHVDTMNQIIKLKKCPNIFYYINSTLMILCKRSRN